MNTITLIGKLFHAVAIVALVFIGISFVNAQDAPTILEVQSCNSSSRGIRCKNPIPSRTESREIRFVRNTPLKTENICQDSSRGTRCKQILVGFFLMESAGHQHAFSKIKICRHTSRGARCYS